jgi:hypothetical protein
VDGPRRPEESGPAEVGGEAAEIGRLAPAAADGRLGELIRYAIEHGLDYRPGREAGSG